MINLSRLMLMLTLVCCSSAQAQTKYDQVQNNSTRATAQQLGQTNAEQDQKTAQGDSVQNRKTALLNTRQDAKNAALNAIQDKAVVEDQLRQDAFAQQNADKIAKIASIADAKRDRASVRVKDQVAANTADLQAVQERSLTDRQFLMLLAATVGVMLLAIWLMLQRGIVRLMFISKEIKTMAEMLAGRTELLEQHIADTTPSEGSK